MVSIARRTSFSTLGLTMVPARPQRLPAQSAALVAEPANACAGEWIATASLRGSTSQERFNGWIHH